MTANILEAQIGTKIRELRKERRWTQQRLAAFLGITQGHLSQLERGNGSFSANQLLAILKHFNIALDYFSKRKMPAGDQIQNALARQGAAHLLESEDILPSEKLKAATDAIREALVSGDSARQIAAIAPVLANHAGQMNLGKLRTEFRNLGLANRFEWAIESALEAIRQEALRLLPRQWRVKYRRAATIIGINIQPLPPLSPELDSQDIAPLDVLDPEITTPEALKEVSENLSPLARKWKIATRIKTDDFIRALRASRGAD